MDNYNNQTFDVDPYGRQGGGGNGTVLAIVSLVLAVAGTWCIGLFATIPALICGIIAYKRDKSGMALAAIIISAIFIVISLIYSIIVLLPIVSVIGIGFIAALSGM